jgi:glutamate transport system substrate-binding protein
VTVGTKVDQFGTGFLDVTTYNYSGLDIDVARYISGSLFNNSDPYILPVSSDTRERALADSAVTFFVATYTIDSDRARKFDLAGPYLITIQGVMVGPHNPNITTLRDLVGKRVCVVGRGSRSAKVLTDNVPGAIPKVDTDYSACLDDLRAGNVEAFSTDLAILYGYLTNSDNAKMRVLKKIAIGNPIYYGIAFRKSDHALCLRAAHAIKDMVHSKHLQRLFEADLKGYKDDFPQYQTQIEPNDRQIDDNSCKNS